MTAPPPLLATVGYEGATQAEVIAKLRAAGVETVLDIRAVASSRRAGFSKTILAASLAEAGVGYAHLRALGTPKPGRDAARKGDAATMRRVFEAQLATPEAVDALAQAETMARTGRIALLCFEADPACCHRRIVAERLAASLGRPVVDL